MQRTFASLGAAFAVTSLLFVASPLRLQAAQSLIVVSAGPDVYCIFSLTCSVARTTTQSTFTLPGMAGYGVLRTSTFQGTVGSAAEGFYGYEYQLDLGAAVATTFPNCINAMQIKLGTPTFLFDYDGSGTGGEQVYVVTLGASGTIAPSAVIKDGPKVTFFFESPVCPGAAPGEGDVTLPIGITVGASPVKAQATLAPDAGGPLLTAVRAPKPAVKLTLQDAILYRAVLALPPGAIVAPSPQAAEGRRRAMLGQALAAIHLAEGRQPLAAVPLLELLLSRMDGDMDDWVQDDPSTREDERLELYDLVGEVLEGLVSEG